MTYLLYVIVPACLSYLFTYPVKYFAIHSGLITDPAHRHHPAHTHQGAIPRGGGLAIFLAFSIAVFIFIPLNKIITGILIGSSLLVIIGLLDDYYDISPYWRFAANLFIASLVIGFGLGIPYISNPFGGVIRLDQWRIFFNLFGDKHSILVLADLLAIVWLTWTTNMVNWSKGVDGQMPGFVSISAFFLGLLSQRFIIHDISIQSVTILSFIVCGAFLGFIPHNFYPQKIMPGYGGGALAGFLLGVLAILSFGKIGTAFLILSIPMIDAVYTIIRRIKKHQSPFRADWGHFHHRLLEIGWGKRRIAIFYWLITFVLGIASLFLKGIEKLVAFITIAVVLLIFMLLINKIKKQVIR